MNDNLAVFRQNLRAMDYGTWALWALAEAITGAVTAWLNRPELLGWNLFPGLLPALVLIIRGVGAGWFWPVVSAIGLLSSYFLKMTPLGYPIYQTTGFLNDLLGPILIGPFFAQWLFIGLAQGIYLGVTLFVGWRGALVWIVLTTFHSTVVWRVFGLIPFIYYSDVGIMNGLWGLIYGALTGAALAWMLRGRRMPRETPSNEPPPGPRIMPREASLNEQAARRRRALRRIIVR